MVTRRVDTAGEGPVASRAVAHGEWRRMLRVRERSEHSYRFVDDDTKRSLSRSICDGGSQSHRFTKVTERMRE
jgi:hypothetical protein